MRTLCAAAAPAATEAVVTITFKHLSLFAMGSLGEAATAEFDVFDVAKAGRGEDRLIVTKKEIASDFKMNLQRAARRMAMLDNVNDASLLLRAGKRIDEVIDEPCWISLEVDKLKYVRPQSHRATLPNNDELAPRFDAFILTTLLPPLLMSAPVVRVFAIVQDNENIVTINTRDRKRRR
mmetsp:Transcript_30349/g.57979  ORF Transcript_30349/g.57979 Transcript_30349/m.57979 type:complete len:179 (-) Transcript_30349:102-638(-)